MTAEHGRLDESRDRTAHWKRWGPYLSERAWGTVREDYSPDGTAWEYFPHDHARSRAYRWNEDGLAGICDRHQKICFALALWNGRDPILKERLFGLTGNEGNHGEDVKEYYFYLDSTPTHSYMKYLYKYPQAEFPYAQLVEENRRRGKADKEFELLDTGVFDDNRYFDVLVEYAKDTPEDILIRITVANRGPETRTCAPAPDDLVSQHVVVGSERAAAVAAQRRRGWHARRSARTGVRHPLARVREPAAAAVHRERDEQPSASSARRTPRRYVKDGINDFVVHGALDAVNPEHAGTKAAAHYPSGDPRRRIRFPATAAERRPADRGRGKRFRSRLRRTASRGRRVLRDGDPADALSGCGRASCGSRSPACSGRSSSTTTSSRTGSTAIPASRRHRRSAVRAATTTGGTLYNADVISMPDKWEYPWYAAWDLAFHCVPLALVDSEFAKEQLTLLLREWYMHPNGQLPAYEWALGDVNPPVHAWAAWRVYKIEKKRRGQRRRRLSSSASSTSCS